MKAAKDKAKAAAATLATVGGAAKSPAATPRVRAAATPVAKPPAAKPARQTAYLRMLQLCTSALSSEGGNWSLQLSFSSAVCAVTTVRASLEDTAVDDAAAALATLLSDVSLGDKAERQALLSALETASADHEAAAEERAAQKRLAQLRKDLEAAEKAAADARARRHSLLPADDPQPSDDEPPAATKQVPQAAPRQKADEEDSSEDEEPAKPRGGGTAPATTHPLADDDDDAGDDDDDDDDTGTGYRMVAARGQAADAEEARRKRVATKKAAKRALKKARLSAGQ